MRVMVRANMQSMVEPKQATIAVIHSMAGMLLVEEVFYHIIRSFLPFGCLRGKKLHFVLFAYRHAELRLGYLSYLRDGRTFQSFLMS